MQTKDLQASEEKRAYFRLLRYLVTNELQAYYREEQARPLQPRLTDFLKELEHYEPSKIHKTASGHRQEFAVAKAD